jgi:hypothetical protein
MLAGLWRGSKHDNSKNHKRKQELEKKDTSFLKHLLIVASQEGGQRRGFIDGCVEGR